MSRYRLVLAILLILVVAFLIAMCRLLVPGPIEDTQELDSGQYEPTSSVLEETTVSPDPIKVLPDSGGPG
jgi:hypothetical protein